MVRGWTREKRTYSESFAALSTAASICHRCPVDPSLPRRSTPPLPHLEPAPPKREESGGAAGKGRGRVGEDSGGSAREGTRWEGRGREESGGEVREKEREEVASDFEGLLVKC